MKGEDPDILKFLGRLVDIQRLVVQMLFFTFENRAGEPPRRPQSESRWCSNLLLYNSPSYNSIYACFLTLSLHWRSKGHFGWEVLNKNCFNNSIFKINSDKLEERVGEDAVDEIGWNPQSLEDVVREAQQKSPATEDQISDMFWEGGGMKYVIKCSDSYLRILAYVAVWSTIYITFHLKNARMS